MSKPAERPPWFAFYPADFANDIKVEAMTNEQVGIYTLLLCKAWQSDPVGSLPDDDEVLARLGRVSVDRWHQIKAGVLAAFTRACTSIGGHVWVQKRMCLQYEETIRHMRRNSDHARKAALSRWNNRQVGCTEHPSGNARALPEHCPNDAFQTQTQTQREKTPISPPEGGGGGVKRTRRKGAEPDPLFDRFWAAYPRKTAKPDAARAFARLGADEALLTRLLAAIERQARSPQWAKDGGQFIPHPATWLNQRRWEDEVAQPPTPASLFDTLKTLAKDPRNGTA